MIRLALLGRGAGFAPESDWVRRLARAAEPRPWEVLERKWRRGIERRTSNVGL
jgi:hypothetical protein